MAQKNKQLRSSSRLLALEPRLLFDGAAMVAAQDAVQPDMHEATSAPDTEASPASNQEQPSTSFRAFFAQVAFHPEGSLKEAKNTSDDGAMTVGEDAEPTSVLKDWKVSGDGVISVTVTGQSDGRGTLSHTSTTGVLSFAGSADEVNQWLAGIQYQYTQDASQQNQDGDSYEISLQFTTYNDKGEAKTTTATQLVNITPQNDEPLVTLPAGNAPHASIKEGGSFSFGAPDTQVSGKGFTHTVLGLNDPDNSADQVIIKIDSLPDPVHGKLVLIRNGKEIILAVGSTLSVAELGNLEYRATDAQVLQNFTDHFTFTIDDGAGGRSTGHVVNLELTPVNQAPSIQGSVTIVEGESNVSLGAGGALTATRSDGSTFTVLSDRGRLVGQDVDDTTLTYKITSLPSIGTLHYNGVLLTAENIGSTTITDLNKLTYSYPAGSEPSSHSGKVSFGLQVTDTGGGEGKVLNSGNSTVELTILENNDDPVLVNNAAQDYEALRDAQLVTDSSFVITTEMLSVSDPDSFTQNRVFKITDTTAPELGYFTIDGKLLAAGTSFTMADVEAGKVKYHLRTTTTDARTDSFNFQVIDSSTGLIFDAQGKAYQRDGGIYSDDPQKPGLKVFTFEVKVPAAEPGPGGDLPALPEQATSLEAAGSMRLDGIREGQGSAIGSGDGVPLTKEMLFTTDSKTPPDQIIYRLETLPTSGTLMLAGKALGQFDSFTQQDINEGRVKFVHSGGEQFSDSFQFSVSNGSITTSGLNTFHITAVPQNDTPVSSQDQMLNVMEGHEILIKNEHIVLSDLDRVSQEGGYANSNDLWFVVTRMPQYGKLLLNGQPITSETHISEADLKAGNLVYLHDGSENFKDNFEIQPYDNQNVGTGEANSEAVSPTNQSSVGEKTVINITITSVNDAPVFSGQQDLKDTQNGQHALQEGGTATIYGNTIPEGATPPYGQLVFTDSDNSATQIQYRITEAPKNGQLLLSGKPLGTGSVFTQADLDAGRITYQHNGGENHSDGFKYTVSDGDYRVNAAGDGSDAPGKAPEASTFSIQVKPTNDKPAVSAPSKPIVVDSQDAANNLASGFSVSDVDIADLQSGEVDLLTVIIRVTDANGKPLTSVDAKGNYTLTITDQHGNTLSAVSTGTAAGYLQLTGSRQEINDALKTLGVGFDQDGNAKFKLQVIVDDRLNAARDDYQNGDVGVTANGGEQNRQDKQELKNIDSKVYDWTSALIQGDTSFNLNVASVDLWVSTVNEAPKITLTPSSPLVIYEDVSTKLESIQFSDIESSTFGTSVNATFTVNSGTLEARNLPDSIELTSTLNEDGSFTITLKGEVNHINAFFSDSDSKTGLFYIPVAEQSSDTNGESAGDVTLTIELDEDASNIGGDTGHGSTAAVKVTETIAITILAANDAPTASGAEGTIIITTPSEAKAIPGFSISDAQDSAFDADGERDAVQVTVRLLDSQGQPLSQADYAGVTLSIANGAMGLATGGVNDVLILRGTVADVNNALDKLQITLENGAGKGLGNADTPYQIQIIVDDRLRNADGTLKIENGKASANGGDKNNTHSGSDAETEDIPTTEIDPYVDSAFGNYALNVDTAERTIWPSSSNEPPVIERDPPSVTLNEDERTFIGGGFIVTDAESDQFGLPVRITVDIGDKGILSIGGSSPLAAGSKIPGTQVTVVSGDETGTLILEGTASAISALLNDRTNGLFFTSHRDNNADHNGTDAITGQGDITATLTINEYKSATEFGQTPLEETSSFYITVNPVNDAPVIGGTSNTDTHYLYPDRGGNGWHWTTGPDEHDSGANKPSHDPINLISGATVTDVDLDKTLNDTGADSFGGGSITVRMNDQVTGDVLSVVEGMPGIKQVSGGSNGQPLLITLSDAASAAQVAAILNAIKFDNDGDPTANGAHLNRGFSIVLNDGNNSNNSGNAGSGGAKDSNTLTGSLKFARYEAPATVADTGLVSNTSPAATGNVLNNDSDKVLVSDSTQTGKSELNVSLINTGGSARGGTAVVLGSNHEGTTVQGTYGTLTIKPDGSYTYTLDPTRPAYVLLGGETVPETFTYRATDAQGLSSDSTLTINITGVDDPVTVTVNPGNTSHTVYEEHLNDGSAETKDTSKLNVNSSFTISAPDGLKEEITLGFIKPDGTPGSITLSKIDLDALSPSTPKTISTPYGELKLTGYTFDANTNTATVNYSYTLQHAPNVDDSRTTVTDQFFITSLDNKPDVNGSGTGSGTISITIVDDQPTAANDAVTVNNSTNTATGNALNNDTLGADRDTLVTGIASNNVPGHSATSNPNGSFTIVGGHGTLIIQPNGSYEYERSDTGPLSASDVFEYTITDKDGDPAKATITITIADKGPVITDKDGHPPTPEKDPADPTGTTTRPVLKPNGSVHESGLPDGSTPGTGNKTIGTITLTPGDDTTTVTVTPPGGTPVTLVPNTPAKVITPQGEVTLTYTEGDPSSNTPPKVTYEYELKKPVDDTQKSPTDEFSVKVTDKDGDSTTVTVVVDIVDDAPIAEADRSNVDNNTNKATGNALSNDTLGADRDTTVTGISSDNAPGNSTTSNPDGSFTIAGEHGTLTIQPNGSYEYVHTSTTPLKATDVFEYTIQDKDGDSASAKITIAINDSSPVLTPPANAGVTPGNHTVHESGMSDGSDPSSGSHKTTDKLEIDSPDGVSTITITPPGSGTPVTLDPSKGITSATVETPNGKVTVTYDPGNGTDKPSIHWEYELTEPADNSTGVPPSDSFTVTVTDDDGDQISSTITIDIVDDMPDAQDDSNSTLINVPVTGELGGNDRPSADGPLTWTTDKQPGHGTVTVDPNTGKYTYTPEPGFLGTDTFTYTVTDKDGSTSSATVTITVTNQPPVAVDDTNVSEPGKPATGNVLTGGSTGDRPDSDPDGQPITVTEIMVDGKIFQVPPDGSVTVDMPDKGTLIIGSDGGYTFTPVPLWSGQVPDIAYTISDGFGGTDTAVLRITVTVIPTASDVPPSLPPEIPSFANQGERPLYDMRGQTPWSGNQFYFPSVFWENPGFGTSSLFPQPFHPVVYVNDEVQRSQALHQTHDIDSQWPTWFAQDHNGLRSVSTYLGMDPALFVQHPVRQGQWLYRLQDFLARNMQANLPMESPAPSLPSATPASHPDSLNTPEPVPTSESQPEKAAEPETTPQAAATLSNEAFSELQARWSTAQEQVTDTRTVSQTSDVKSRPFSEQLKNSAHQLPSHIG